ncbi:rhomboid family intramembrane serine protease [Ralstonia chuxiongensis]|uniref:Rhomboid family intramembrane serine protease n=1 Tax=Ralstonia chuxiongensis TaxID=2957504 RepID=A0AA42BGC8_9RALS|nr:rhomboid family intramembrane serine protease [Ralstonia chuxiongensis]MCP1170848.1 rhomboid family intramembrane serine protease [Ralstonia chuxiongensis]
MIKLLILTNVAVFCAELFAGDELLRTFALWPLGISGAGLRSGFMPWQPLTYAFLHANGAHLVLNMFGLYMFGRDVERTVGTPRAWLLYVSSILSAAFAQIAFTVLSIQTAGPVIGASGGVFGLILAYAVLFPNRMIVPLIPPIPMPAWVFATLYAIVELTLGMSGTEVDVAHFAHLGGMAGSGVLLWHWLHGTSKES